MTESNAKDKRKAAIYNIASGVNDFSVKYLYVSTGFGTAFGSVLGKSDTQLNILDTSINISATAGFGAFTSLLAYKIVSDASGEIARSLHQYENVLSKDMSSLFNKVGAGLIIATTLCASGGTTYLTRDYFDKKALEDKSTHVIINTGEQCKNITPETITKSDGTKYALIPAECLKPKTLAP